MNMFPLPYWMQRDLKLVWKLPVAVWNHACYTTLIMWQLNGVVLCKAVQCAYSFTPSTLFQIKHNFESNHNFEYNSLLSQTCYSKQFCPQGHKITPVVCVMITKVPITCFLIWINETFNTLKFHKHIILTHVANAKQVTHATIYNFWFYKEHLNKVFNIINAAQMCL